MDGNPGSLKNGSRTNTQQSCCSVSECQLFSLSKTLFRFQVGTVELPPRAQFLPGCCGVG